MIVPSQRDRVGLRSLRAALLVVAFLVRGADAAHAAELCESAVEGAAGKMLACRLQAESKNSRSPDPARREAALAKCDASFLSLFRGSVERYGSAACSPVAADAMKAHLLGVADGVERASRRDGSLPSCAADLAACSVDLEDCTGSLASSTDEAAGLAAALATRDGELSNCRSSLSGSAQALATCEADRTTARSALSTCAADASTCNSSLASCNAGAAACGASLATCTSGAAACGSDLASCRSDGTSCASSLAGCTTMQAACSSDLAGAQSDLASARAGTAVRADVLTGRSFTSADGDSVVGTMPNRGAISIVPGPSPRAIPEGFHDGSGTVAGDPALVPSNIRSGQSIFGVAGTAEVGAAGTLGTTGETTNHGPSSDGGLRMGLAAVFVDNGDGTITDPRTGLTWEKKSRDGSVHDVDATWTWGQASPPHAMNGSAVSDFLAALDTVPCHARHCDWRIPNLRELQSIVDFGRSEPAIHPAFDSACTPGCDAFACSCTSSASSVDLYWTSTTSAASPGEAWAVGFGSGAPVTSFKGQALRVRAVRGGTSTSDLCAAADLDPADALASAACKAIHAFARDDFQSARDYLLADVVARRFRVAALAGMWPMFLRSVASADSGARLYTRIGDASKTATLADLALLEGVDAATGPALFCRSLPYPADYAARLAADLPLGGYETTHVLLALLWVQEQGCTDPSTATFREQALAATAALIDADHGSITDLELEAATLLAAMGESARVPAGFLPGVLAAQRPSGAWPAGPGEAPLGHTTGLALWYLHEVRFPGSTIPVVTALPR